MELGEGSLLALYTDGLVEAADWDIGVGLELLRLGVSSPADTLEETCDQVLSTVLTCRPTTTPSCSWPAPPGSTPADGDLALAAGSRGRRRGPGGGG